jgi:hypothetical protein
MKQPATPAPLAGVVPARFRYRRSGAEARERPGQSQWRVGMWLLLDNPNIAIADFGLMVLQVDRAGFGVESLRIA